MPELTERKLLCRTCGETGGRHRSGLGDLTDEIANEIASRTDEEWTALTTDHPFDGIPYVP